MRIVQAVSVAATLGLAAVAGAGAFDVDLGQLEALTKERQNQELKWNNFAEMNDHYEYEFVHARSFGWSRMPKLEVFKEIEIAGNSFRVGQVQLVGIVDREAPAVYQTHAWHKKEQIKTAQHRQPTAAETAALKKLENGAQWVPIDGQKHVLMGALRSKESCTKCHDGTKPNQLLGAFRYQLAPTLRVLQLKQPQQPVKPENDKTTEEPETT